MILQHRQGHDQTDLQYQARKVVKLELEDFEEREGFAWLDMWRILAEQHVIYKLMESLAREYQDGMEGMDGERLP